MPKPFEEGRRIGLTSSNFSIVDNDFSLSINKKCHVGEVGRLYASKYFEVGRRSWYPGGPSDEKPLNEFQALVLAFEGKATKKTSNLGQSTTRPMPLHMPSNAEYDAKVKLGKAVN